MDTIHWHPESPRPIPGRVSTSWLVEARAGSWPLHGWLGRANRAAQTATETKVEDQERSLTLRRPAFLAVMEPADPGLLYDLAHHRRLDVSRRRRIFVQGEVGSRALVVGQVGTQDAAEMYLAKDDHSYTTLVVSVESMAQETMRKPNGKSRIEADPG